MNNMKGAEYLQKQHSERVMREYEKELLLGVKEGDEIYGHRKMD